MKLMSVMIGMLACSGAVFSMEVIDKENALPFSVFNSGVVFSMGVSDGKKTINSQGKARHPVKKIITDYYPLMKKHGALSEPAGDVKRRRIGNQPLSEIDTNSVDNEGEERELSETRRGRSGAIGSLEELQLLMTGFSIN